MRGTRLRSRPMHTCPCNLYIKFIRWCGSCNSVYQPHTTLILCSHCIKFGIIQINRIRCISVQDESIKYIKVPLGFYVKTRNDDDIFYPWVLRDDLNLRWMWIPFNSGTVIISSTFYPQGHILRGMSLKRQLTDSERRAVWFKNFGHASQER